MALQRINEIIDAVREYHPGADVSAIQKAYVFSAKVHKGQVRRSGEPYLSHPLAVTKTLANLRMDVPTLCGGLLHDVMEDCGVKEDVLRGYAGDEVTQLVVGYTKRNW